MFADTTRFRALEFLGQGALGHVYRVYDQEFGGPVALKTLHNAAPDSVYRLKNEFRSLAGVVHPNVVHLYDLIVTADACSFTMEYVPGVDFVQYVRGDGGDPTAIMQRLLVAAPQLLEGLDAVHAAGRLHRDLKPPNIRVTPDGLVKLLDFDLVVPRQARVGDAGGEFAGTLVYMPPEQAHGRPITEAADLYAFGVILYEALTGALPFAGEPLRVLRAKTTATPPPPRVHAPFTPTWLDDLVIALMQCEPLQRPELRDCLRSFGRPHDAKPRIQAPWMRTRNTAFVGRDRELATLRHVCGADRQAETRVIRVEGLSGIGKTELVRYFVAECEKDGALVLRGRCHPQETVAYKSLDAIVDELSRVWCRDADSFSQVDPTSMGALARLFPVLRRVPVMKDIAVPDGEFVELRRQGIVALRRLFSHLGSSRPLILWIDDLQWGDADSAVLLREVLRPPAAPPLLLILSYRSEERTGIALLDTLHELAEDPAFGPVHVLEVGPLDPDDARRLAEQLYPEGRDAPDRVAGLIGHSGGSPFFLAEMAWHLGTHDVELTQLDLARILAERLHALPPEAQHLAELVAVAARPIERKLLLRAAEQGEHARPWVLMLESQCVVRTITTGEELMVQTYHDQICDALLAELPDERRAQRHFALAHAFEQGGSAEPQILAHHFHGAGLLPKAAAYANSAADKAAEAFAFERAAAMYRAAREWEPSDLQRAHRLSVQEAEALTNAGRFVEAAGLFSTAAQSAAPAESLQLRGRAVEQFLAGGRMDDGIDMLTALLGQIGLRYPQTPRAALVRLLVNVLRFRVRGFAPRPARQNEEESYIRGDTCYSAARTLVDRDPIRGVYFSTEALRHFLRASDPIRQGLCLLVVGGSLIAIGGPLRGIGERMMGQAEKLAEETGAPLLRSTLAVQRGQLSMLAGRWREAVAQCDEGIAALQQCHGGTYESFIGRTMALRAVEELGDIRELERRALELRQLAKTVDNRFSEVAACQHLSYVFAAQGDIDAARRLMATGRETWRGTELNIQSSYSIRQEALCGLYVGDAAAAFDLFNEIWPALLDSHLLRIPLIRVDMWTFRGRLALHLAQHATSPKPLLAIGAESVRRLRRERRGDSEVDRLLLQSAIDWQRHEKDAAGQRLDEAAVRADAAGMALYGATARYRRGQLQGGAAGGRLIDDADAEMRRLGVHEPARWVNVLAPGFDRLQWA